MMESFGSLCDQLAIVKLKQMHADINDQKQIDLLKEELRLQDEIDELIAGIMNEKIPMKRLTSVAN